MASGNRNEEPSTAPEANRWYNITLGPSLKESHSCSPRFCTLRYEFKPASIDNMQSGSLYKSKDNRVTVEFQNNQHGKPKVSFEGVNEDYKDKDRDAVLFFDGETFRLEKLHRAVNRLRYLRVPGESVVAPISTTTSVGPVTEPYSSAPPASKITQAVPAVSDTVQPVKMVQIDINNPVSLEHENEEDPSSLVANLPTLSQNPNPYKSDEDVNIDGGGDQRIAQTEDTSAKEFRTGGLDIDINLPHPAEMDEDEIADVDINDEEPHKGLNAAEALRAQVNAEAREGQQKSSSSSGRESESTESGSESTDSGSESSSSSGSESGSASDSGSHASV